LTIINGYFNISSSFGAAIGAGWVDNLGNASLASIDIRNGFFALYTFCGAGIGGGYAPGQSGISRVAQIRITRGNFDIHSRSAAAIGGGYSAISGFSPVNGDPGVDQIVILNGDFLLNATNSSGIGGGHLGRARQILIENGLFQVTSDNMTKSRVGECVACMETKAGVMAMRFCIVWDSHAVGHNGGLCVRNHESILIERCVFAKCRHKRSENDVGAALLVYENPFESSVADADFLDCDGDGAGTITVASGRPLLLARCRFSGTKASEINMKNVALDSCLFRQDAVTSMPFVSLAGGRLVGFNRSITLFPRSVAPGPRNKRQLKGVPRLMFMFACACGISFVISGAVVAVQAACQGSCGATFKRARALQ
jgi:hypothetical protein